MKLLDKIFKRSQSQSSESKAQPVDDSNLDNIPKHHSPIFAIGVRFPALVWFFLAVGALSEVVDAMFMNTTLEILSPTMDSFQSICISAIVGAGCFASMAFLGFQRANPRYYSAKGEKLSKTFWLCAGAALVSAKLIAGLVDGGLGSGVPISELLLSESFIANFVIAAMQLILYFGTGYLTRDSMEILTNRDRRERSAAQKEYVALIQTLSNRRGTIMKDISILKSYQKYAERLLKNREGVLSNVSKYNEAARALIEARMAISVEPELMEDIYDKTMEREAKMHKAKATA